MTLLFNYLINRTNALRNEEDGALVAEYGIVTIGVVTAALAALLLVSGMFTTLYQEMVDLVTGA